jgi:Mg-chelatase subunit ChlD
VQVLDGTYFNIRAFEKPYGDYSGAFKENPYRLAVTQKPVVRASEAVPVPEIYMNDTVKTFKEVADATKGETHYAKNPDEIMPLVRDILDPAGGRALDLVFVIDATESMMNDMEKIRELLEPLLAELLPSYPSWRVALVLYKDYYEDFTVKEACSFTQDLGKFRKALGSFRVQGGRDIPEAVYEALDSALGLAWNPGTDRKIVLIGDAPPHPKPRGKITRELVEEEAKEKGVQLNVIILPHGETE